MPFVKIFCQSIDTIDIVNRDVGLITASRQTTGKLAEITKESDQASDDGLPKWAKVVLIGTGIILVVILIAAIAGSDGDEDDEDKSTTTVVSTSGSSEPAGEDFYQYRVTVNLEASGGGETKIRVSAQGSRMKGDKVTDTGPVYDPEFFQAFYASMDKALFLESEDAIQPVEDVNGDE